jgi:hypothetical protein
MPASESTRDEEGAVLLLALLFVLVISLTLIALANLAGNDLLNTSHLKSLRSLEYAADGGVESAVQGVRYNPTIGMSGLCTPGVAPGRSITMGPVGNAATIQVFCSGALNAKGRVINFAACPLGSSDYGTCASKAVLLSQVTFDDYALNGTPAPGTGVIINSWVVQTANH